MTAVAMSQPAPYEAIKERSYRFDAIDLLRGLVMIIMALDHTRDYFHKTAWTDDPLNLATTTPYLYFTRWITHFCAPVFVFLAGTSAFFQSGRKSTKELSLFLIKRGLWLIFVEIIIMNFAFTFDIHFEVIALQTIWAIGISMIILGLMIWLPFTAILIIGSVIVLGHNALDFLEKGRTASPGWWYDLIHHFGLYPLWANHNLMILYPFLSWAGLMMLGYCFGKLYTKFEGRARKKMLIGLGLGLLVLFAIVRATNLYGDPDPWSNQKNSLYSFFSFMKVHKYPPSLLYMCATIGPALIFLALTENSRNGLTRFITVYGRVPFFYYILHFFLLHLLSSIFFLLRGHSFAEGLKDTPGFLPKFVAPTEGYSLFIVYVIWLAVVISLYPLCKWFSDYKQRHKDWWLSYL